MAAHLENGSGLCALCNGDILDWGSGYQPPEYNVEVPKPAEKKPLVQLESADEIIANTKKLEQNKEKDKEKEKEKDKEREPSEKDLLKKKVVKKKLVKKASRTIMPESSDGATSPEQTKDEMNEGGEVNGDTPHKPYTNGIQHQEEDDEKEKETLEKDLSTIEKEKEEREREQKEKEQREKEQREREEREQKEKEQREREQREKEQREKEEKEKERKQNGHGKEEEEDEEDEEKEVNDGEEVNGEGGEKSNMKPESTFDDLYKRYLTKNPGKIGSLSPQQPSPLTTKKLDTLKAEIVNGVEDVEKDKEKEKEKDQDQEKTAAERPAPSPQNVKIGFGFTPESSTSKVIDPEPKPSNTNNSVTSLNSTNINNTLTANGTSPATNDATNGPSNSTINGVNCNSSSPNQSGNEPGESSRLKYLEDYFEILPNDDEETAEIKKKLIARMRNKRQNSFQRDKQSIEESNGGLSKEVSPPLTPIHPAFHTNYTNDIMDINEVPLPNNPNPTSGSTEVFEVTREHWMPDERAPRCSIKNCDVVFNFWNRRHHCRRCGDIVCGQHSQNVLKLSRIALPDPNGIESKVCDECYNNYRSQLLHSVDPKDKKIEKIASESGLSVEDEQSMRGIIPQKKQNVVREEGWIAPQFNQLHFKIHPKPQKIDVTCSDCGSTLPTGFLANIRYCEAVGRYFCVNCQTGKKAIIPGRVLENWDFTRYEVCDKSYNFLNAVYFEPSYCIEAINPQLYEIAKPLGKARAIKKQLEHILTYLSTCSTQKSARVQHILKKLRNFDPVKYSMSELAEVEDGTYVTNISEYNRDLTQHIFECELCRAKGFICEICKDEKPFFSFEPVAKQCDECKQFFHQDCYINASKCPKCERVRLYRLKSKALEKK